MKLSFKLPLHKPAFSVRLLSDGRPSEQAYDSLAVQGFVRSCVAMHDIKSSSASDISIRLRSVPSMQWEEEWG